MTDRSAIEITGYDWVPDLAKGKVKDMRVRWALNEIDQPYTVRLVGGAGEDKSPEHLADQPFGQVPVYREAALTLFESGAILLHIGAKDERLLPSDETARARAISWMFAALNSIEPFSQTLFFMDFVAEGKQWQAEAKDSVRPYLVQRLTQLAKALGDREWLESRFTAGDLLMVDVLRAISEPELIAAHSNLSDYVARGVARPAFRRALASHMASFAEG